jgi:hypothetical protein
MADYRMYCLKGAGKIGPGEWLDANTDDEALARARAKMLSVRCEVWAGNRLVGMVPASLGG